MLLCKMSPLPIHHCFLTHLQRIFTTTTLSSKLPPLPPPSPPHHGDYNAETRWKVKVMAPLSSLSPPDASRFPLRNKRENKPTDCRSHILVSEGRCGKGGRRIDEDIGEGMSLLHSPSLLGVPAGLLVTLKLTFSWVCSALGKLTLYNPEPEFFKMSVSLHFTLTQLATHYLREHYSTSPPVPAPPPRPPCGCQLCSR